MDHFWGLSGENGAYWTLKSQGQFSKVMITFRQGNDLCECVKTVHHVIEYVHELSIVKERFILQNGF